MKKRHLLRSVFTAALPLLLLAAPLPSPAQDAPDDSPAALYQSGISRFLGGQYEQSLEFLNQLVQVFGREPELRTQIDLAMYARACAYFNLQKYEDAIKAFGEYQTQFPESKFADEALYRIGVAQQQLANYNDAVTAYRSLPSKYPRSSYCEDAMYRVGLCYLLQDASDLAAAAFKDFMANFPSSPLWGQAGAYAARATFDGGDPKGAIALLQKIETRPRTWTVVTYCNFLAFEIGDALFDDTEYADALLAYRRVKTRRAVLRHLQTATANLEAELAFLEKRRVTPQTMSQHFREVQSVSNLLSQNKAMLEKLESMGDYDANLFHRIGRCYFNTDRFWEARVAFSRVVGMATDETVREAAHFDLVLAISRLRRFDDLLVEADQYLSIYDPQGKWQ